VQRSWPKPKLQPNELKLRSTESDSGWVRLLPSGYALPKTVREQHRQR
jgi:hypothetical protein